MGVEVDGMDRLRVPLHDVAIIEEELSCRFKKKEKKLIVTVPIAPPTQAPPPVASRPTVSPESSSIREPEASESPVGSSVDNLEAPADNVKEGKHLPVDDSNIPSSSDHDVSVSNEAFTKAFEEANMLHTDEQDEDEAMLIGEEATFMVPKVELPRQEGLEHLMGETEKVADARIVNGVSDFSIFRHSLGKEFDAIYAATRAKLPSIELDDDNDDDDDAVVEVLDASGKLEALKQRT